MPAFANFNSSPPLLVRLGVVRGKTAELVIPYNELATVTSKTTPSISEFSPKVDATTIKSVTTIVLGEITVVNLYSTDYFNIAMTAALTFNTAYAVAGSVGVNDTDDGSL